MHPPDKVEFATHTSSKEMELPPQIRNYAEFKGMLCDWTAKTAHAIKNGGLSTEDANNLLIELAILTEIFSAGSSPRIERLNVDILLKRLRLFDFVAKKVIGDSNIKLITPALTTGASMQEFEEWASGVLGNSLTNVANSILGIDWKFKDEFEEEFKDEIRDRLKVRLRHMYSLR